MAIFAPYYAFCMTRLSYTARIAAMILAAAAMLPQQAEGRASRRHKAVNINVCSFNISYDERGNTIKEWDSRRQWVCDFVRFLDLDVFGTQEGVERQVEDVAGTDYAHVSAGGFWVKGHLDIPEAQSQHLAIYWKPSRFELVGQGRFWLSPTPDSVSVGWDAAEARGCLWVRLRERTTRRELMFFCTHIDHMGREAKMRGSQLVLTRIKELAKGLPAFCVGDFNGDYSSDHVKAFAADGYLRSAREACTGVVYGTRATFCSYDPARAMSNRYDYIWVSPGVRVNRYGTMAEFPSRQPLSDHMPIIANVDF